MSNQNTEQKHREDLMNPMLIESYFDGELKSDEFDTIQHEDIVRTETWQALEQLRHVVKMESELALDDIDGLSLLDAIHDDIDAYEHKKSEDHANTVSPVATPSRNSAPRRWTHWIPAMVGAALFLASIPGLVGLFNSTSVPTPEQQQQPSTTVVYVDGNGYQKSQDVVCPSVQQPMWYDNQDLQANGEVPSVAKRPENKRGDQLTVEEMDNAIRLLIRRIESLEEVNRQGVEKGDISLQGNPDQPVHRM